MRVGDADFVYCCVICVVYIVVIVVMVVTCVGNVVVVHSVRVNTQHHQWFILLSVLLSFGFGVYMFDVAITRVVVCYVAEYAVVVVFFLDC